MNRNNIYTVNPLYNGSTTQATGDDSVQSGGTTIIYQQGGGTGLTDAQKQKLDGIQEGAEVNQNAYSKVRLNGSDTLIIEAKNKTDILNMSGVYPIAIAINGSGGLDFTVSSDQTNTNAVVTQSQLQAAIEKLQEDKYWKVDEDGKLYTELDVYSHKEISAYGAGTGGGSTGGAGALYECADVLRDGDKVQGAAVGSILSYNGSHWYAIPQSAITPDLTNYATKSYVTQQINDLIGGAPGTLDTLKEIAEALGNNPNFATTVTEMINNIGLRVDQVEDRVVSLEDMFEWDKSASASDPSLWRIKAKKDLYGVGEISAYGYSSGTVPTGAQYMYELKDVLFTELTSGQLLQWNGTKWINIDKNAVGLNETELAKYLTNNNYAKKSDITWANLLNKPTTWGWASITGKPTTLAGYGITDGVSNTRRVSAGSGLAGGGVLSSDVTISLGTIGTAGTYTKITTDMYGRVVSGTTLSESDIPTLQISKISGLQSALNSKLNISDFNTWFTIKKDSQGRIVSIQANYDFFSVGEISAYGYSSGTVPTGAQYMYELKDVLFTELTSGQLLQWNGTKWINIDKNAVGLNETELAKYLTNNNYAKKSDITWANLLNKPTTWGWASITGKPTTLAGYGITDGVSNTRRVSAGSGLAGGGVLSSDVTISLGTIGTAGTYTKITTDMYGRVVSGTTLSESDIPTLQISKISGLQSALNSKLNISDFNTWFTIKKDSQGRIVSIQANYDFFSVGEISAYGLGETQPSVTTLTGLDDVTITSPANGQTLIYDSATSQWKNGTIIGGGNISLNGTVYKPVNGVITLPNLKPAEPTWFSLSNGNSGNVQVRTTGRTGYYEFWDTGAEWAFLAAKGYKTPGGTSSQFLKADGSVDSNVYLTQSSTDTRYVLKTGDTMGGALIIDVPNIPASPSISSPTKIGFKENHAQEVAFAYTDYDSYRAPAGIKLVSTENEPWFEAPWILGRKLNMSRVATEYSAGTGAVINYFGTDTIMDNQSSSITGTLKIRLPVTWTNTMGVYKIMLYEYNGRGSSEITVSFYNYSSSESYYNYSYQVNGGFEGAVRIAHDGSKCCILLGDTSYTWNYPKVYVHQIFGGQNISANYFDTNFNISIITSEAGLSKVTSIPKTSMNRHDDNYIRAINKNGYYGMGKVGNIDTDWIRTAKPGLIPFEPGSSSGNSFLGTETWQFGKIFGAIIYGQRVCSLNHNLYLGSSGNSGWVYCQDLCSANGAAEAYWSIRTNGAAVFTNLTSKNTITGNIDGYATYLPTRYNGGTQANPQTYFSQHMGLRVAMTGIGWGGPWGDTLWINGYSGNDVLPMCALHFIRNGTPRFGISTQNSNGTSYGTNYEVWTAYNSNKDGVNWSAQTFFSSIGLKSRNICIETDNSGNDGGCSSEINNWNSRLYLQHKSSQHLQMCNGGGNVAIGGIDTTYKLNVSGDIRASSWIRTDGATGWYSQSYGGGIYMTDSDMVQVYNNKVFYNSGYRSWGIGGHYCGIKLYNTNHIGINLANAKYTWGIYSNQDGNMYIGRRNGDVNNTTGSYIVTITGSTLSVTGSVVASGEVTAYSDAKLKSNIHTLDYRGRLIPRHYVKDGKQSIGFIAQEVQTLYPELVLGYDKSRPYLSLNYNGCTAVLSAQLNHVEDEVTTLKNKVKQLESEVTRLNALLPSQGIQHVS